MAAIQPQRRCKHFAAHILENELPHRVAPAVQSGPMIREVFPASWERPNLPFTIAMGDTVSALNDVTLVERNGDMYVKNKNKRRRITARGTIEHWEIGTAPTRWQRGLEPGEEKELGIIYAGRGHSFGYKIKSAEYDDRDERGDAVKYLSLKTRDNYAYVVNSHRSRAILANGRIKHWDPKLGYDKWSCRVESKRDCRLEIVKAGNGKAFTYSISGARFL